MAIIRHTVRVVITALVVTVTSTAGLNAQSTPTYELVASFTGVFANGASPASFLIEAQDGNFYGTSGGGLFGAGTVFRIAKSGDLTTQHHFSGPDGQSPARGVIQAPDGSFYGTTTFGGTFGGGTIFRFGTDGQVTTLHNFTRDDDNGTQPRELIQGSTGAIFGFTPTTVYQLNSGGGVTTLRRFEATAGPNNLVQGADGSLYGTTRESGINPENVFFRLDLDGTFTPLHTFTEAEGLAALDLIQGQDGNFYGVTLGVAPADATIFKIDTAGTLTTLYQFTGGSPGRRISATRLVQGSDGSFYGGTAGPDGFIFKFDPNGTLTPLHSFTDDVDGSSEGALILASDGNLYGTQLSGGQALGNGGTVYRLDLAGTFNVLYAFGRNPGAAYPVAHVTEGSDNRLYGTTEAGGLSNVGTVFAIDPSGASGILHSFTESGPRVPRSGLVQASDGRFFGTTTGGFGFGAWTIFAMDGTGTLTTRYVFPDIATPQNPGGYRGGVPNGVIQAADGRLYGTTMNGFVYSLPLTGAGPTYGVGMLGNSDAPLFEVRTGTLYGTARTGGSSGLGAIFSVPVGSVSATIRHSFSGLDGSEPQARVIEGLDGNLYGTTAEGGAFGFGTVFRFEPAGTLTTLHHFAGHGDGSTPVAGLVQASDGRLYGTTSTGGASGLGTIFTIDSAGALSTVHTFAGLDGGTPFADLIQASDGHLYGTTRIGGPGGGGVVFRLRLGTTPPTDGYVEIVSRNSGKCLDIAAGSTEPGASVLQWSCHGGPNQQWRLEPAGGGAVRVISRHSGEALDVAGGSVDDGAAILQWPVHGGDNQAWTLEPAGDGYVRLVVRHSGKAMDVEAGSTAEGARVLQWTPHSGANQQWLLRPVE